MDISFCFKSVSDELIARQTSHQMNTQIHAFVEEFPEWETASLIIVGIPVGENGENTTQSIRKALYQMARTQYDAHIVDVGDIWLKQNQEKDIEQIVYVLETFLQANKTIILIGGDKTLLLPQYIAYQKMDAPINIACIDAKLDIEEDYHLTPSSVMRKVLFHEPFYLNHFTVLGLQVHWVSEKQRQLIDDLRFEYLRLSEIREDFRQTEAVLRWSNLVCLDMSAVRYADAPATLFPNPVGFTLEEACRISRYAGISDLVRTFSITNVDWVKDSHRQTVYAAALNIWYFLDGYSSRWYERVDIKSHNLIQYHVVSDALFMPITFYKHPISERWWIQLPEDSLRFVSNPNDLLVPCTEKDYYNALEGTIPKRWWNALYKIKNQ
ncbi:MAG: arginase family protein [Bacteroidia bacterium]|nr:arginase family protein [Bacteroidia bacterium]MDW8345872.1 arginase family protein [Bacteroidia bacterium]